jgi:hypothetical protein
MKRFSEQFHKKSQSVKLKAVERDDLRERLVSYMEYHPLPAELRSARKRATAAPLMTEAFTTVSVSLKTFLKSAAVMAAVVLVTVPYLAERAVPGDPLYAVKVSFNEEIRSTLTFDSAQRVEWETERLNRRIAEARLLASEGRLTEEVEAEVADAVRIHSQNAKREIEVLRALDADEATIASIALESTLAVQATALNREQAKLLEQATEGGEVSVENSTDLIAVAVNESRDQADVSASSTAPSYEKLMARVEQNTTRIYELRSGIEESVSEAQLKEVSRRVEDIERSIQEAISAREENDEDARAMLVEVFQRTQKLIVYLTELEVSQNLDIEEVVPVVLTPEEQRTRITGYQEEIAGKRAAVATLLAETPEDELGDLGEKLELSMTEVDGLMAELATSTEYQRSITLALAAQQLVDDALIVLGQNGVSLGSDEPIDVPSTATSTPTNTDQTGGEEATSTDPAVDPAESEPANAAATATELGTTTTEAGEVATGTPPAPSSTAVDTAE